MKFILEIKQIKWILNIKGDPRMVSCFLGYDRISFLYEYRNEIDICVASITNNFQPYEANPPIPCFFDLSKSNERVYWNDAHLTFLLRQELEIDIKDINLALLYRLSFT